MFNQITPHTWIKLLFLLGNNSANVMLLPFAMRLDF